MHNKHKFFVTFCFLSFIPSYVIDVYFFWFYFFLSNIFLNNFTFYIFIALHCIYTAHERTKCKKWFEKENKPISSSEILKLLCFHFIHTLDFDRSSNWNSFHIWVNINSWLSAIDIIQIYLGNAFALVLRRSRI